MQQFIYYIGRLLGYLSNMIVGIAKYFKGYFVILLVYFGLTVYFESLGWVEGTKVIYLLMPLMWWIFFEMRTRQHTHEQMFKPTIRYIQHFIMNTKIFWKGD